MLIRSVLVSDSEKKTNCKLIIIKFVYYSVTASANENDKCLPMFVPNVLNNIMYWTIDRMTPRTIVELHRGVFCNTSMYTCYLLKIIVYGFSMSYLANNNKYLLRTIAVVCVFDDVSIFHTLAGVDRGRNPSKYLLN